MKYCLLCGTEYLDHVDVCADDGEPLVDASAVEEIKNSPLSGPLRVLRTLEGPFHAHMVKDVLEKEEIPHAIHGNVDTAYGRTFLPGRGWGLAMVLEGDVERADAAVRKMMEATLEDSQSLDEEDLEFLVLARKLARLEP